MKNKIKYFFKRFIFLKALNSPFKPFKLKWYIGKVAIKFYKNYDKNKIQ